MKFSALLISFFLFLVTLAVPTFAQSTNSNPNIAKDPHLATQSTVIEFMSAIACQITGIDPVNPRQSCLGVDPKTNKIGFVEGGGGAIGFMNNMISTLYTPPVHTVDYFQNLARNFGITKPAYAQGTGFDSLSPLIKLWSAFRNIVYLAFVIVFIVIGMAIMLRVKIDPRTVMTVQNQIPKIIVSLILVTFSFAIAGFLIDLMWTTIYLLYSIISGIQIPGLDVKSLNPALLQGQNPFDAVHEAWGIGKITGTTSYDVGVVISRIFGDTAAGKFLSALISGTLIFIIIHILPSLNAIRETVAHFAQSIPVFGPTLGGAVGVLLQGATSAVGGAVIGHFFGGSIITGIGAIAAFIVIGISLLFGLFRIWFVLLMSYVSILIDVVLAPFWIIGGLIPGSQINASVWARDLIANLAAFPAVIGLLLLGKVFTDAFAKGNGFVPPLIGNPGDTSVLGSLISLGIIFIAPHIVSVIKTALKVPKLETGGAKTLAVGTGITGLPGKIGQVGLMLGSMQHIPILNKLPGVKEQRKTIPEGNPSE